MGGKNKHVETRREFNSVVSAQRAAVASCISFQASRRLTEAIKRYVQIILICTIHTGHNILVFLAQNLSYLTELFFSRVGHTQFCQLLMAGIVPCFKNRI